MCYLQYYMKILEINKDNKNILLKLGLKQLN